MTVPTHAFALEVLLLQAANEGRGPVLFEDSLGRARNAVRPFMVGRVFPDVYLEFPLMGEPFLDLTVLYGDTGPGISVDPGAAPDAAKLFKWFAEARTQHPDISFGFELDTKHAELPVPAVHFQPREHIELVEPFCKLIGEAERARLYLEQAARMPQGWPLSFFGLFRGRPGSPLRVCGYLSGDERKRCAAVPQHLASAFDAIGFSAYDETMLAQIATLLGVAPGQTDFQFDVYPDGTLGSVFAVDVKFGIEQPASVRASFEGGPVSKVMELLEGWHVVDERWKLAGQAAFARALPIERDDGTAGRYAFTLMPQWLKVRWDNRSLQPSKLYCLAHGGLIETA